MCHEVAQTRVAEAIAPYRRDRSPRVLLIHSLYAITVTLIAVGLLFGFRRGFHRLNDIIEQRLKTHLKALEAQSAGS
ncbi:MAG: hypothetical protein R3F40_09195 [Candidatus Competibacteraceae bacterium]